MKAEKSQITRITEFTDLIGTLTLFDYKLKLISGEITVEEFKKMEEMIKATII